MTPFGTPPPDPGADVSNSASDAQHSSFSGVKEQFVDLLLAKGALRLAGSPSELFELKSGRRSPVYINLGALTDAEALRAVKDCYAATVAHLIETGRIEPVDFVFGPAYKGISLAALVTLGMLEMGVCNARYLYDRKETKLHGDRAMDADIVGAAYVQPGARILIVDDVITTGGAKFEAVEKLKPLPAHRILGVLVGVDREERGGDANGITDQIASDALRARGIPVFSIVTLREIHTIVRPRLTDEMDRLWEEYFERYLML